MGVPLNWLIEQQSLFATDQMRFFSPSDPIFNGSGIVDVPKVN
jgi:hypothetical protein